MQAHMFFIDALFGFFLFVVFLGLGVCWQTSSSSRLSLLFNSSVLCLHLSHSSVRLLSFHSIFQNQKKMDALWEKLNPRETLTSTSTTVLTTMTTVATTKQNKYALIAIVTPGIDGCCALSVCLGELLCVQLVSCSPTVPIYSCPLLSSSPTVFLIIWTRTWRWTDGVICVVDRWG